jgi:hypothetical protein
VEVDFKNGIFIMKFIDISSTKLSKTIVHPSFIEEKKKKNNIYVSCTYHEWGPILPNLDHVPPFLSSSVVIVSSLSMSFISYFVSLLMSYIAFILIIPTSQGT